MEFVPERDVRPLPCVKSILPSKAATAARMAMNVAISTYHERMESNLLFFSMGGCYHGIVPYYGMMENNFRRYQLPEKQSPYATYGEKLIKLFAKLLFSGQSYSLSELSRSLVCSKQTVLRLMDDIRRSYGVEIEETIQERNKYFRIKKAGKLAPALALTQHEVGVLLMCQAFARHLLGDAIFGEASTALDKNRALAGAAGDRSPHIFTSYRPGTIDYTPHEESIRSLLQAMEKHIVCKVSYRSIMAKQAKTFFIMPLKIFSHNDTMYVSARFAGKPGEPQKKTEFDPLLAVHRIRKVDLTHKTFVYPKDFDFENTYNRNFGIIKNEAFNVEVEFTGHAARYVSERIWSPDQKLRQGKEGKVRLTFSASSKPELKSWLLSFGEEARLITPEWFADIIKSSLEQMNALY
jgi:predicted DNA-binding transcriptional regulator YafY